METDLGHSAKSVFTQPHYKDRRKEEAYVWGQKPHNVPGVKRAESGNTGFILQVCFLLISIYARNI